METIKLQIADGIFIDIFDGEELQNQPQEAQEVYNNYID